MVTLDGLRPFYDVVVVGARAAGAATAMLLARHGQRVLLVDRQPYGSDTLSTHALMRAASFSSTGGASSIALLPRARHQ
jgi:flavin-dependent dehydrogenase